MNQILITQKLYITPELKRKKRMYKINFIISVILIVILFSFYAYAEYDRNKNADISQDILAEMSDNTVISNKSDVWIVALDGEDDSKSTETVISNSKSLTKPKLIFTPSFDRFLR